MVLHLLKGLMVATNHRGESFMNTLELVRNLWKAIESQDFDRALSYLAYDFQFSGPVPFPLNAQQWIDIHHALARAMPDLTVGYQGSITGNQEVIGSIQLTGHHTGELSLPVLDVRHIPATGHLIVLSRESFLAEVRDGKVYSMYVEALPNGGLPSMLAQMGLESLNR